GPEDRKRPPALPPDRQGAHPRRPAEVPHEGRADRQGGQAPHQHPRPRRRAAPLPLRRQLRRHRHRRRQGGRRRRQGQAGPGQEPGRHRPRPAPDGGRPLARRAGRHPRRGAEAPAHRAQGQAPHHDDPRQVQRHPHGRPRLAPPLQAVVQGSAPPADHVGELRPGQPGHHPAEEGHPLPELEGGQEPPVQRGDHLHDGRVRLDGRRAEGARPPGELLDRHLAAQELRGHREPLHRPRRAGQGGRQAHVLPPARGRRHEDQQRVPGRQEPARRPLQPRRVEHLPVPLLRRRQQLRGRQPRVRQAAEGATPARLQHVRLLPGRQRLRLRQLHQRAPRTPARPREGADEPGELEGRHLRLDQDVLREGAL
ncbi:MAG: YeaH_YhbH, partial [uncultured Phycisphaerae bacterium]